MSSAGADPHGGEAARRFGHYAPGRRARALIAATAAGGGFGGRGRRGAVDGHLPPQAAGGVDAVALVLARGLVAGEGVQRVPVVGGLLAAVGPGNGAERAGHAGAGGHRARDHRPEGQAGTLALGRGRGVDGEPVQDHALGVGQHLLAADGGLRHGAAARGGGGGRRRAAARAGGGRAGGAARTAAGGYGQREGSQAGGPPYRSHFRSPLHGARDLPLGVT